MKILLLNLLWIGLAVGIPTRQSWKRSTRNTCGYQSCTTGNADQLNVHIVPHSHDDVGWLKTIDQYYWGARNNIQRAGVQYIIDSVVTALERNPDRRFIQVESAFLYKWWEEQTEERRSIFKDLVDNGRLEIINGAWSMNDEAAVHYQSIIDQFTLGLRTVDDTLGECGRPKVGWQIDPFGHSKEMASIFSQMGYDGLFFSRLDWRDKSTRLESKTAEMLWQGSQNLGDNSNLFTSVLYNHYSAPSGYCFDILCTDDPIIDDESSPEYNYEEKINGFAEFIQRQAANYATNNIIITMGDDFNYQDALSYFTNLDKIVVGFKQFKQYYNGKLINVFYSTPSCYLKAVNEAAELSNLAFALKTDDFFPYANDPHAYWSGYFTSRPTSKRFERQGNNILQATKQLASFVRQSEDSISELRDLQETMGIMQHHDAITGTEKQHVADDYHRILTDTIEGSINKANSILSILLPTNPTENVNLALGSCLLANITVCNISTDSSDFIAAVYNPLSRPVSHYVRLPVTSSSVTVIGPEDQVITTQILPTIDNFDYLTDHYDIAPLEVVFLAEGIPPLGVKLFKVSSSTGDAQKEPLGSNVQYKIGDAITGLELDPATGLLQSVTLNGITLEIQQELMYYVGARGNNDEFENRASGAYIFRPSPGNPEAFPFTDSVEVETYTGELVDEIHQTFSSWAKQVIRLYKNANYVEFDWLVGPIDVSDDEGKEIISRFTTSLETADIFYTDANGREMVERRRNYRKTYQYTDEELVAGNYYPITSKILLKDAAQNLEFAVLNDRAQGGSSLLSGQVELMVHRRLLDDDAFGVGEALNEEQFGTGLVARGQHYVTFGPRIVASGKTTAAVQRDIAQQKLLAPWTFLSRSWDAWDAVKKEFSGLTRDLPQNLQILTLEPWKGSENTLLVRLEHVLEKDEDPVLSLAASINLDGLFTYFDIVEVQEMTLAGNQLLAENERLEWLVGDELTEFTAEKSGRTVHYTKPTLKDNTVELTPMQIRTFLITVTYK